MAFSASDISKAALLAIIFALTTVGNVLVGLVLVKSRRHLLRNRPTYQFILNIVLSDLVVGLLTMPFEFVRELLHEWTFGVVACKIIEFVEIAVSGTAVFTHALIAFDRYRSLARPYLPKMEASVVRKLIVMSWVVPALASSPYLYMFEVLDNGSTIICTPTAIPVKWLDKLYEAVDFVIVLLIPFLVLCWCYYRVSLFMWGRNTSVVGDSIVAARNSVVFRNKKRVTRTSILVAISFTMCWFPTFVMSIVRIFSGTDRIHRGHLLHEISMFGIFINEAINPIIYCAFDRNIKGRIRLNAICAGSGDSAGSSNDADRTHTCNHNTVIESGHNQLIFRNLDPSNMSTNTLNIITVHGGKFPQQTQSKEEKEGN